MCRILGKYTLTISVTNVHVLWICDSVNGSMFAFVYVYMCVLRLVTINFFVVLKALLDIGAFEMSSCLKCCDPLHCIIANNKQIMNYSSGLFALELSVLNLIQHFCK